MYIFLKCNYEKNNATWNMIWLLRIQYIFESVLETLPMPETHKIITLILLSPCNLPCCINGTNELT